MTQVKYFFLMVLFVGFFKANAQKIYRIGDGHMMMMTMLCLFVCHCCVNSDFELKKCERK